MKLKLFQSSPDPVPAFPMDLDRPFSERSNATPHLPSWVYQALEFERLMQMQAQIAPQEYVFAGYGFPEFRILGWKLGSSQFEAPPEYGHPEFVQETFWVACHLTPELVRTRSAHGSPVGANRVWRICSAQAPESRSHQGVSLGALLPTAELKLDRWTAAGEVFRHLAPRTYPEAMSHRELVVLSGE